MDKCRTVVDPLEFVVPHFGLVSRLVNGPDLSETWFCDTPTLEQLLVI